MAVDVVSVPARNRSPVHISRLASVEQRWSYSNCWGMKSDNDFSRELTRESRANDYVLRV